MACVWQDGGDWRGILRGVEKGGRVCVCVCLGGNNEEGSVGDR